SHNRMVRIPSRFFGIVSFSGPLLVSVTGKDRRVKIQGIVVKMKVAEKPLVCLLENPLVGCLVKLLKIALEGTVAGHLLPSEYFPDHLIAACDFKVFKT